MDTIIIKITLLCVIAAIWGIVLLESSGTVQYTQKSIGKWLLKIAFVVITITWIYAIIVMM